MKKVIRYAIGVFSIILIGAVIGGMIFLKLYTKGPFDTKEYRQQHLSFVSVSENLRNYYEAGYLVKSGFFDRRCGYISKYDAHGKLMKTVQIDDQGRIDQLTEPVFLQENKDFLYAVISTYFSNTNKHTCRILKLDKESLAVEEQTELNAQLADMRVFVSDESGFWFSAIGLAGDKPDQIVKTDLKGNIVRTVDLSFREAVSELDAADEEGTQPKSAGAGTRKVCSNYEIKLYEDRIYICATMLDTPYSKDYSGLLTCLDFSGNVIWQKEKMSDSKEGSVSQYMDFWLEDGKIFVVGAQGQPADDSDLESRMTPVIDVYDGDGSHIDSYVFENQNESSGFHQILKTADDFLVLGHPILTGEQKGYPARQVKEVGGMQCNLSIDWANSYIEGFGDQLIGTVNAQDNLPIRSELYKDHSHFLQMNRFLSFLRWVEAHQTVIYIVWGAIVIFCFYPIGRPVFLRRKSHENKMERQ